MPRLLSAVIAGSAVLLLTGDACAGTEEVEGLGFRARAPVGFRLARSDEDSRTAERVYETIAAGGGEIVLAFRSHDTGDTQVARTEMAVGRMIEPTSGLLGAAPQVGPAQVAGADDAFEVLTRKDGVLERTLTGRQDTVVVTLSLSAPLSAEAEADEIWRTVSGTLRLEHPGAGVGTIVVWVLVALVVLAVLVTVMKRSRTVPAPATLAPRLAAAEPRRAPPALERDPFMSAPAAPQAGVAPGAPAPLPTPTPAAAAPAPSQAEPAATAGPPLPTGAGFSRAEDGLPVFTKEEKAAGLPDQPLKRRPAIRPAPLPTKSPGPAPLNRPPVAKPPLPVFKITKF
jgi:hypothetical protein